MADCTYWKMPKWMREIYNLWKLDIEIAEKIYNKLYPVEQINSPINILLKLRSAGLLLTPTQRDDLKIEIDLYIENDELKSKVEHLEWDKTELKKRVLELRNVNPTPDSSPYEANKQPRGKIDDKDMVG